MKWLALITLLGGCDYVFHVGHVDEPTIDAAPEACPSNYVPIAGTTTLYRFVPPMGLTWDAAELSCESDSRTKITHLVVFGSAAEIAAVRTLIPNFAPSWQLFAGFARNTNAKGGSPLQFTSVTGMHLSMDSDVWEKVLGVEPDDGGSTSPGETITFFEPNRNMSDAPATNQLGFVCECDGIVANQMFQIRD